MVDHRVSHGRGTDFFLNEKMRLGILIEAKVKAYGPIGPASE